MISVTRPDPDSAGITSCRGYAHASLAHERTQTGFGREGGGLAVGPKRYLFSGLLKCSVCGGSIALVSGRGRHSADRYGCSVHHQRGDSVSENAAFVTPRRAGAELAQRTCGIGPPHRSDRLCSGPNGGSSERATKSPMPS